MSAPRFRGRGLPYWLLISMLLGLTVAWGSVAVAQQPEDEVSPEQPTGERTADEPVDEDLALIESLLEEDEAVVEGGLAYDPGDRRDPFRSLLVTVEATRRDGPRPEGIPGLLIDELIVTGVWVTDQGPVAQVQSSDDPVSYLLREGDHLFDGDLIRISYTRNAGAEVEFKQIVDDPTAPKPFREIVKRVEP